MPAARAIARFSVRAWVADAATGVPLRMRLCNRFGCACARRACKLGKQGAVSGSRRPFPSRSAARPAAPARAAGDRSRPPPARRRPDCRGRHRKPAACRGRPGAKAAPHPAERPCSRGWRPGPSATTLGSGCKMRSTALIAQPTAIRSKSSSAGFAANWARNI